MKNHFRYRRPAVYNNFVKVQARPLPWTARNLGWNPAEPTPLALLLDRIAEYFTLR